MDEMAGDKTNTKQAILKLYNRFTKFILFESIGVGYFTDSDEFVNVEYNEVRKGYYYTYKRWCRHREVAQFRDLISYAKHWIIN